MTAQNNRRQVSLFLQGLERVLLLTHVSPDVDGISSLLALGRGLEILGKNVIRFIPADLPRRFFFWSDLDKIVSEPRWREADAIVTLDCGDLPRTGFAAELHRLNKPIVNIDHHPQKKPFGTIHLVEDDKTSTAEIIFHLLNELGVTIDKALADMLLAGIVCDTQSFQVASTSAEVLNIASQLMRKGARIPRITKEIFRVKPITALKLWGRVLDRVQIDKETKMAYSVVRQTDLDELGVAPQELEGIVDLINAVTEAKFSLLLTETGDNIVKGSLRSENFKAVDVSRIAKLFGGGGHKLASGFRFPGKIEERDGKWLVKGL